MGIVEIIGYAFFIAFSLWKIIYFIKEKIEMSTVKNNGATNVKPVRPNFGNTNRPNLVNTTLNSSSADDIDIDFDEDELLSIDDPVENTPIIEKEQQEQIPIQPVTPVQNTNKKVKQPKEKKVKRPKTHNVHKEKSKKSFRYMDCMLLGHKLCDKRKYFWL